MDTGQIHKVLILGANPQVSDSVSIMPRSLGYQCVMASSLKQALPLLQQEKPDAAILDPQAADLPPARAVAMFHNRVPDLQGRSIVLIREESDPALLEVLDAYSFPRVRVDALFRGQWQSLDSLLHRTPMQHVFRSAPLVFDSLLEPSPAGVRSSQRTPRQLLYESDILVADLSLEGQRDSQRMTLSGQVLDTVKRKPQLSGVPIVIQGAHTGLLGIAKTNEWGEFHFEFEPEQGVTLEIRAREDLWVSAALPDLTSVMKAQ